MRVCFCRQRAVAVAAAASAAFVGLNVVLTGVLTGSRSPSPEARPARNVILLIGDGFGPAHMVLGMYYAWEMEGRDLSLYRLMQEGMTGYALTVTHDAIVTDSAASASQMASGTLALNETLGLDGEGRDLESILEWAERQGLATGLVTNTRIYHGTPGGFAAHHISRYGKEQDLADQVLGEHEIDVLFGGGARACVPRGSRVSDTLPAVPPELDGLSNRDDDRNLIQEARERGYSVVHDRARLRGESSKASKLLGLFSASHLPYVLDRKAQSLDGVPRLEELTEAALEVLGRSPKGFFLMVEGGQIDFAAHDHDAGSMIHEILEFDRAVDVAMRFQAGHPDTLIIVTADHSTGGFSFTYSLRPDPFERALPSGKIYQPRWFYPGKDELAILAGQTASYELILERAGEDPSRVIEEVERGTGLRITMDDAKQVLVRNVQGFPDFGNLQQFYTDADDAPQCMLGRALAPHTSVVWSTGGHTSDPVLTFGLGPGAERLRGIYVNTHIYEVMKQALTNSN